MSAEQPLEGKRILITRAVHQAERLAEALEAKGAEVVRLPTIEIVPPASYEPLDANLENIKSFDWLILTSVNGAEAVGARMKALGLLADRFAHLQIAAIGPATAAAVRELGLHVDVIPGEYVAESVVLALKDRVAGKRVLLARAAVARDVIPEELRQCGAEVEVVEAYQTVIPSASIACVPLLFAEGTLLPDAVTFTSSSTVKNFFALLSAAKTNRPPELRAVSIGPVTTRTLREHNWEPSGEATRFDIPGLVEACVRLLVTVG